MSALDEISSAFSIPIADAVAHLPAPFHRMGPKGILWWQWLALALIGLLAWPIAALLRRLSLRIAARLAARTSAGWDDALLTRLPGPVQLAWWLLVVAVFVPALDLSEAGGHMVDTALGSLAVLTAFWALLRSTDVLYTVVSSAGWATSNRASRALLPLAARAGKVAIVALAIVAFLAEWGFPVASLLAGLGIGGLALALAAQKTVENLFGSFSIGIDQPFREGDFVKVEDFVATVERIGLRSTRFRTLERTLISMPNGKLADMRLETFAPRDRLRLFTNLVLPHDVTPAQLREVLAGLEAVLRAEAKLWPEGVAVKFKEIGNASLTIEVNCWFATADWGEFLDIRQRVLLGFLDVVEKAGTRLAAPAQLLVREPPREAPGDQPARPPPRPA